MYLKREPVEGELSVITKQQAGEADYSLSPSRWINGSSNAESADLGALLRRFEALREADKKIEGDLAGALAQLGKLA